MARDCSTCASMSMTCSRRWRRLKEAGLRPILDYEFETVYDGKRSRIQEVYLSTNEVLGGATIQLLQVDPLE